MIINDLRFFKLLQVLDVGAFLMFFTVIELMRLGVKLDKLASQFIYSIENKGII